MVQRAPFHHPLVLYRRSKLPRPALYRNPRTRRLRHNFHIRVHQHRYLPPVSRVPTPQERRRRETSCLDAHRCSEGAASFRGESRLSRQLHWSPSFQARRRDG